MAGLRNIAVDMMETWIGGGLGWRYNADRCLLKEKPFSGETNNEFAPQDLGETIFLFGWRQPIFEFSGG